MIKPLLMHGDRNLILKERGGKLYPDLVAQQDLFRQFCDEAGISLRSGCHIYEPSYELLARAASKHDYSITVYEDDRPTCHE